MNVYAGIYSFAYGGGFDGYLKTASGRINERQNRVDY
jgi:hypothetical protein